MSARAKELRLRYVHSLIRRLYKLQFEDHRMGLVKYAAVFAMLSIGFCAWRLECTNK